MAPLREFLVWEPMVPSPLSRSAFLGTYGSLSSFKECLFQELIVPRPPSESAFLGHQRFIDLLQRDYFSRNPWFLGLH
jgi:hypothetical protein